MSKQKTELLKSKKEEKTPVDSKKRKAPISKPVVRLNWKENFLKKLGYRRTGAFLGLDIGSFSMKMVELKKSNEGFILLHAGMEGINNEFEENETPFRISLNDASNSTSAVIKSINKLIERQKINVEKVVSTLPGDSVVERFLRIPFLKKKELEETLEWEAKKILDNPQQKVIFDYSVIGKDNQNEKYEILLTASHKEKIMQHLKLLGAAGLKPLALETKSQALHNALLNTVSFNNEVIALIDIGANFSILNFSERGSLRLSRNMRIGGQDLTKALANELGWSVKQAEDFKKREAFLVDKKFESNGMKVPEEKSNLIQGIITDYVDKLITEIQRSFEYLKAEFGKERIDILFVTGGGSKLKNLDQLLENKLGVRTKTFNPFNFILGPEELTPDWEALGPHLTVAFGSATWSEK
jgi:type IV pilus assembly protein PilM